MRLLRRLLILLLLGGGALWVFGSLGGPKIQPGSVLIVDVEGSYYEAAEPPFLSRLLGDHRHSFLSLWSLLRKAERDERIAGVVLRVRRNDLQWASTQELADALRALKRAGRKTVAYLETESLGANREYLLASAADEIVISPATSSPLIGIGMEFLFLGGLWEKLGAGIETIGAGEYKSAAEILGGRAMSEPHREMANSLLDATFEQFVTGIAQGRGLDPQRVRELIDASPTTPDGLVEAGLADAVGGLREAIARIGPGPHLDAKDYAGVDAREVGFDPKARFALVLASGTVLMGEGTHSPSGSFVITSETISKALRQAADDPEIRAVVLRVESPGGSPLASDLIWQAAQEVKRKGKPLIASVSNVAASGGYYILCGADAIVASPTSLVGSIGVFAMRPTIGGMLDKLGIAHETLARGRSADILLASRPLSPEGRDRLTREIFATYDLFVGRVAEGRKQNRLDVQAIARGRVWTGAQGLEKGLVDELGGLRAAVDRAKEAAGLARDSDVELVPYPEPVGLGEQIATALQQYARSANPGLPLPPELRRLQELLGELPQGSPLLVPPFLLEMR